MGLFRKISLWILVLTLVVLTVVTWGSIASIIFCLGLLWIIPAYLFHRFINTDEPSDFTEDQNI